MRLLKSILLGSLLGVSLGWAVAWFMAERYWRNEGKVNAITYLYYQGIGLTVGFFSGAVIGTIAQLRVKSSNAAKKDDDWGFSPISD